MKRIAMLCLFTVISTAATAGFDEGLAAYNNKEYAAAIKEWQPLAEQGNESAQFNLGLMYHNGRGVERDDKQSAYWYDKAAKAGSLDAQFNLALMYEKGQGVPQDYYMAIQLYKLLENQTNVLRQSARDFPDAGKLWVKVHRELGKDWPPEFVDARNRWDQEKAHEEESRLNEKAARQQENLSRMDREQAIELAAVNETKINLKTKKFRQTFVTSSVCRDFERQSNAMMTRWEIGMSHPDEGRKFLSDVAVSFDECSRSAGFGKSKLRDAYISNFNGIKLMQSVWERGISACMDGDRLLRSAGGGSFNNCKWMEMPIQDYEGRSIVSELKSSVVGYGDLIEREAERRKYRNYFGPVLKAVGDRLIKF